MVKDQEVMEITNSHTVLCVEGRPAKAVLAQIYGCTFHSLKSWYNFCSFLSKPSRTAREKHCFIYFIYIYWWLALQTTNTGPGFDSRALLRIFLRELGLERGPLSLVIG
jgi:hypothetical protein